MDDPQNALDRPYLSLDDVDAEGLFPRRRVVATVAFWQASVSALTAALAERDAELQMLKSLLALVCTTAEEKGKAVSTAEADAHMREGCACRFCAKRRAEGTL